MYQGYCTIEIREYDQSTFCEDPSCRVTDSIESFLSDNEDPEVIEAIERARWGEWTTLGGGAAPLIRIGPFDPGLD